MSLRGGLGRTILEDLERDERVLERMPERVPERSAAYASIAQRDLVEAITNGVLEGIQRGHREEMVDAVTNIRVDPPDLQPILDAISRAGLGGKHEEMLEAITNIVVDPPDLSPILSAIRKLDLSNKHNEMLDALTNIVIEPPDLTQILRAIEHLNTKHAETLKALTSIEIEAPDLTPILKAISRINPELIDLTPISRELKHLNIDGRHTELLQAITKINSDVAGLTPIAREVRNLNLAGRHAELLQAINAIDTHPDFSHMEKLVQDLRAELRQTREELASVTHRDVMAVTSELRQDFDTLRKEIHENRQNARNDAEALMGEIKTMPHVLGEIRQALRKFDQKNDLTEVLQCVHKIKEEVEVDMTGILQQLKRLEPDHHGMASIIIEQLKKVNLNMNQSDVLQSIKAIKSVDNHELANAVCDRLSRTTLNVNNEDVLKEMRRFAQKIPDIDQLAKTMEVDFSPVTSAIADMLKELRRYAQKMPEIDQLAKSMEVDFSPVTDAIADMLKELRRCAQKMPEIDELIKNMEVDFTPVTDAISALNTPIMSEMRKIKADFEEIAGETHERLEQSHAELLQVIKKLNVQTDLSPILSAISSAEVDFSPIHEAIKNIDVTVDHTPLIQAIQRIKLPNHEDIADIVHDRLRRSNLFPDLSEVLKEIRNTGAPDFGPVLEAINSAEIDLSPVHEAVKRIQVPDHNMIAVAVHERLACGLPDHGELIREIQKVTASIDHNPVLQAVENLRAEILSMRGMELKVAMPTPTLSPMPAPLSPRPTLSPRPQARLAVQTVPTTMPLIPMMPSPVAPIVRAPATVSTTIVGEPKVIAGYMPEATPDPLLRSMEYAGSRPPTRQHVQMQPSPQALGESAPLPMTSPTFHENNVPLPTSYAAQIAQLESNLATSVQSSAQPVELVEAKSPKFSEQVRSASYQPAMQARYSQSGSLCVPLETPSGIHGALPSTDKVAASARDTSPTPGRATSPGPRRASSAASPTPIPSSNSVASGPRRRPF